MNDDTPYLKIPQDEWIRLQLDPREGVAMSGMTADFRDGFVWIYPSKRPQPTETTP